MEVVPSCPPLLYLALSVISATHSHLKTTRKMKQITLILVFLSVSIISFAQTAGDALRYSYWQYGGSARYMATAGSTGALGGDYSSIISNPASIASFRRSEFTFTPGISISGTKSKFAGSTFSANNIKANINHASIIFAQAKPGNWKTINFGLGYNKLADFNQKFNYTGKTEGSIVDHFLDMAQGSDPSQLSDLTTGLAYDTDLIYLPTGSTSLYENDFISGDQTTKFQKVNNSGSMGEMNLSAGGNFDHKLYVGASIGIPFVNYTSDKTYEETDEDSSIPNFNSMKFREYLNTTGIGFNINIGAIYRVNQAVRLGASFHSPTWLSLTDSYSNDMSSNLTYVGTTTPIELESESEIFNYEYRQSTPMRLKGHMGFIIKKLGFVSAEVEYLNYAKNKYNFNNISGSGDLALENQRNDEIQNLFQSTVNIKIGTEFVVKKQYRVRAGYALFGNPYVNNTGLFNSNQLSIGAGYRKDNFFVDLAYVHRTGSEFYQAYAQESSSPMLENDLSSDNILLTVGLKFGK